MSISYIGSATGINSIASMPAHQVGDLLLFFAFRWGSITAPSLPSGKTNVLTKSEGSFSTCSCRVGYLLATSNSELSGTWTNATSLICHVYRGVNQSTPIGGMSSYNFTDAGGGSSTIIEYRAVTMTNTVGLSWVIGFVGGNSAASFEIPPAGMINKSFVTDATNEAAGHDTNGGITNWATQTVNVIAISIWVSAVIEIIGAANITPTKLQIIPINLFDDATNTATSSAAGFEIANAETEYKNETWRSTSLASQTITSTWATSATVSCVGMAFTNLHAGSTIRIKLYTGSADTVPIMDSGIQTLNYAYSTPKGFSTIGLIAFAFGGGTYYSTFFADYSIKKCEIILTSPSNPDGYIEIGRIIIGDRFEPTYNARVGIDFTYPETTQIKRTKAGDQVINRGTQSKQITFDLERMPDTDRQSMVEIFRRSGLHNPIFICLQPDNTGELFQSGQIYGRKSDNGVRYDFQNRHATKFTIEEI